MIASAALLAALTVSGTTQAQELTPQAQEPTPLRLTLGPPSTVGGSRIVRPFFDMRLGLEVGGFEDTALWIGTDLGVMLWDQLGIVLGVGTTVGGEFLRTLPAADGRGPGVVSASSSTLSISLDVRYRFHLLRGRIPVTLDLVAGVRYAANIVSPSGLAFYAASPGCEVLDPGCAASVGPTPENTVTHGVGAYFGLDLHVSYLELGYRFMPAALAYDLPTMHVFTLGFSY